LLQSIDGHPPLHKPYVARVPDTELAVFPAV
jgi:hypothetical protein